MTSHFGTLLEIRDKETNISGKNKHKVSQYEEFRNSLEAAFQRFIQLRFVQAPVNLIVYKAETWNFRGLEKFFNLKNPQKVLELRDRLNLKHRILYFRQS